MTKRVLITKTSTKRVTAAAIAEAKARNGWSNADAGDALDCSEGTVRLRTDGEDVGNQMTVHELRRITQADGAAVADRIFADLGYRLSGASAVDGDAAGAALQLAASKATLIGQLIAAAADDQINRDEAKLLLPQLAALSEQLTGFMAHLRAVIEGKAK